MKSFYPTINSEQRYIDTVYRIKGLRDKYLFITEYGSWAVLSKRERKRFLRRQLTQEDFDFLKNKGLIITPDNVDKQVDIAKRRYIFLDMGVTLHILIPTLSCNHRCIYCHSSVEQEQNKTKEMTEETADKIIDFIFQSPSHSIKIEFQGGEPLLKFDLFKYIVTQSKKKNQKYRKTLSFALVTNMTLMTEEKLSWISKEGVKISSSLDGNKEVHDANRQYLGGQGTYDMVMEKTRLAKSKNIPIGFLMVTTKKSLPFWKEIIDEYIKVNASTIQLKYLSKLGFAVDSWEKIGYTAEDAIISWKKSIDYIIELNKRGIKIQETMSSLINLKMNSGAEPGFLDFRTPCGIASGQLAYNYNGDIYSCDEGRNFELFNLGNVKDVNYKEVIGSLSARQLVESSIIDNYYCDACAYKPYCGTCPVLNYAENNNIIPNVVKSNRCKIIKAQFDWLFDKIIFDDEASEVLRSWKLR